MPLKVGTSQMWKLRSHRHCAQYEYTITTAELLRHAKAVAESFVNSGVSMPTSLRNVVERAVRARQRCLEWFRESGVDNTYADKQHTCFIGVLEQSLKILEPCVESHIPDPARGNHQGHVETSASISNRFSSLKMEESPDVNPVEVFEVAAAINIPLKANASKTDPELAVYELNDEEGFDDESAFIIFCK
ncbi:MAG: hypothetical protein Q9205_000972 [Flavoplaca limonia]